MTKHRIPEPNHLSASTWLLTTYDAAKRRDPVDAANDAEYLAALLRQRADDAMQEAFDDDDACADACSHPGGHVFSRGDFPRCVYCGLDGLS